MDMDKETMIKEKLNKVFCEVFQNPAIQIQSDMTAKDVAGWDSLNHVTLIYAIEVAFKVRFSVKEANGMKNVGDLVALLAGKTA